MDRRGRNRKGHHNVKSPEEKDWEKMVDYIDDQIDRMQSIEALDLTNVQLATNVLLMKLPEDFSNAIRNGLRISRKDKGNEDFKFTPQEFREVMNDTVMSWKTTQPHLVESTIALQTTIPQSSQPDSQGKNLKKNSFKSFDFCVLCETKGHRSPKCTRYVGGAERRRRLISVRRCPDCGRRHADNCTLKLKCFSCSGEHLGYLCAEPSKANATK